MKEELCTDSPAPSGDNSSMRKGVVFLLALVVYIVIGMQLNSARSHWLAYEPWFGQPVDVLHYTEVGDWERFDLRLSEEQHKQWVDRFELKAEESSLNHENPAMIAVVQLLESSRVSLQKRYYSSTGDEYTLEIERLDPAERNGEVKEERTEPSAYVEALYSIVRYSNFFLLPVLVSLFLVKPLKKGCFSGIELILRLFWTWVFVGGASFGLIFSMISFGSYSLDNPVLALIISLMHSFIVCSIFCVLLYLLTAVYRWIRENGSDVKLNS